MQPHVVLVECPSARFLLATQRLEKCRLETPRFLFVELYRNVRHRVLLSRIFTATIFASIHALMKRWCDSLRSVPGIPGYSTWSWYSPLWRFHMRELLTKQVQTRCWQCAAALSPRPTKHCKFHTHTRSSPCRTVYALPGDDKNNEGAKESPAVICAGTRACVADR
ncbi:hypothetical protein IQ06DRAFT_144394 [Phaeosphaeriaceae sp. SRC1lsM3a]|nr:hypothetical protein IQ06DRAFT_144394 [Stagonospora sp. SRC1lsM3a]